MKNSLTKKQALQFGVPLFFIALSMTVPNMTADFIFWGIAIVLLLLIKD